MICQPFFAPDALNPETLPDPGTFMNGMFLLSSTRRYNHRHQIIVYGGLCMRLQARTLLRNSPIHSVQHLIRVSRLLHFIEFNSWYFIPAPGSNVFGDPSE